MTTLRTLIKSSLRKLNVVQIGEEVSADDMNVSLEALNSMIDSWSNNILAIHKMQSHYFPLKQGQETYKLGPTLDDSGQPTGADWVIDRPMRVSKLSLLQYFNLDCPPSPNLSPCNLYQTQIDDNTIDYFDFNTVDSSGNWVNSVQQQQSTPTATAFGTQIPNGFCSSAALSPYTPDTQGFSLLSNFTNSPAVTFEVAIYNPGTIPPSGEAFGTNCFSFAIFEDYIIDFRINQLGGGDLVPSTINLHVLKRAEPSLQDYSNPIIIPANSWVDIALVLDNTNDVIRVFANGITVFSTTISAFFNLPPIIGGGGVAVFLSGSGVGADEFRSSNIARYTGNYDIYRPNVPVVTGGCTVTATPQTIRYPMKMLPYDQYGDLRLPLLANNLPRYAYDDGAYPVRNIHVWPVPSDSSKAIELWLWSPLFTYDSLDDQLNLPPGYERAISYNLCIELASEFQKQLSPEIVKVANESLAEIKRLNQTHPQRRPSSLVGAGQKDGIFNWLTSDTLPSVLR